MSGRTRWVSRRPLAALGVGLALGFASLGTGGVLACLSLPTESECAATCATARGCGLLPSALGGSNEDSLDVALAECEQRCSSTITAPDSPFASLLARLASVESPSLCTLAGQDECAALIDEIQGSSDYGGLQLGTALTMIMADVHSYVPAFEPEIWCTSNFFDAASVALTQELAIPTKACFDLLQGATECATAQAAMADTSADAPCRYVQVSQVAALTGLLIDINTCLDEDPSALVIVQEIVSDLAEDWGLDERGVLISDGVVEPDLEVLELKLNKWADRELRGDNGIFSDACLVYEEGLGATTTGASGSACDGASVCSEGECAAPPLCRDLDCEGDVLKCDNTMCENTLNGPSRDCGLLGIQTIRLGYLSDGVRVLDSEATSLGCDGGTGTATFTNVALTDVKPIAIVTGTLPDYLVPVGGGDVAKESENTGEYTWQVEGEERWTQAGTSRIFIASPYLTLLVAQYSNPLEMLGWVHVRLPPAEGCIAQTHLCETFFNNNCDDGLDNDGNGLVDRQDPWCDPLFNELAKACVVTHQGLEKSPECASESPS
jgi:hypothetical protein